MQPDTQQPKPTMLLSVGLPWPIKALAQKGRLFLKKFSVQKRNFHPKFNGTLPDDDERAIGN